MKKRSKTPKGICVPFNFPTRVKTRAGGMNATNASSLITTTYMDFIDVLRSRLVVEKAGATVLDDLHGLITIPRKTSAATVQWLADGGKPTAQDYAGDSITLTPHLAAASYIMSRGLIDSSSLSVDALAQNDLLNSLRVAVDKVALVGAGTNEPIGILNTSGVANIANGTNGLALTYAKAYAMVAAVDGANALDGDLAFVGTPQAIGALATTVRAASGVTGFIYDNGSIAGFPAYSTANLPSNGTKGSGSNLSALVFGNFNDLIVGIWGNGFDLVVDPFTEAPNVKVTAYVDVDVAVRHPASFAISTDIVTG